MMSICKPALAKLACIVLAGVALAACQSAPPQKAAGPMACDDSLKTAFNPDALTSVVSVRSYNKGDKLFVSDAGVAVTLAADLCLVKLKVGPGQSGPKDARSTSEGIGIEVWLPTHANWNQRIRNYGGGGYVGGNHLIAEADGSTLQKAVGSKFPAPVIAGMGYASGTTDAGQRWSQNGSFMFLPDGSLNETLAKDFSYRSLVEQAIKTRALVSLYYGQAPRYSYFDGHSTGGRQGWKIAQEYPDFYDGYLIAAPAINTQKFALNSFYPQVVMKTDLGYTSADPQFAAANFRQKVEYVNRRAVQMCDREQLGFLLDPSACNYDPAKDAAVLCPGVQGDGVQGVSADTKACVNLAEARVIDKFWYGLSRDGSYDTAQSAVDRAGRTLGAKQLWWGFPRGSDWGGLVSSVSSAERLAMVFEDVRYAPSKQVNPMVDIVNALTEVRDKWREVTYGGLVDAYEKGQRMQPRLGDIDTDRTDLTRARDLGRKIVTYTGLAEDSIPPATSVNHYERIAAGMGGDVAVQSFLRLYLVPGKAHSSQGRGYVVGSATDPSRNNTVPLPKLPGIANQTPGPEQDQMFSALRTWVESGTAPEAITLSSRDNSVSYPICVYPKKAVWDGVGLSKVASSYRCQ